MWTDRLVGPTMPRLLLVIAVGVVSALGAGAQAVAQARTTSIADSLSCPQCTIARRTIFSIGGDPADSTTTRLLIASLPSAVIADNQNRFWLLGAGKPVVFDSVGRRLDGIGRGRDATRQFKFPYDAMVVGDSVVVFDPVGKFASVLAPDLSWVRDIPFDILVHPVVLLRWPDRIVGAGQIPTSESIGWPLHRISMLDSGVVRESFGGNGGRLLVGGGPSASERVVLDGSGGFWSFRRTTYTLSHWDSLGKVDRVLERRPGWFSDGDFSIGSPVTPPSAALTDVRVDASGLLWVFISVPSPTYRTGWPAPVPGLAEIAVTSIAFDRLYNTLIEVIDPQKGSVVARSSIDGWIISGLRGGRAVAYATGAKGATLTFVSLSLEPPSTR